MNTFLIIRPDGTPRFAALEYKNLIFYIRRHAISNFPVYKIALDSWGEYEENIHLISDEVYADAYNSFVHFKDVNFDAERFS